MRRSRLNNGNVSAQRPALANIDAICMRFGRQAYNIISGMILMYCSHRLLSQIELNNFEMLRILWDFACLQLTKEKERERERKSAPLLPLLRQLLRKD